MLTNKYSKWYFNIINTAKTRLILGYTETHHILPKSLGGSDTRDNLVRLTAKEHFVCHRLLPLFTEGEDRRKMLCAVWAMTWGDRRKSNKSACTAHQYEIGRKACAEAASMYRHTEESKKKISVALTGKPKSESHKRNTGLSSKGRTWKVAECANPKLNQGSKNPRARHWILTTPSSETINLHGNFKAWCSEHGMPSSTTALKIDGTSMSIGKWAGWKVERL